MDRRQSHDQFPTSAAAIPAPGPAFLQTHDLNEPSEFSLESLREAAAKCRTSCSEDLENFRALERSMSQHLTEEREYVDKELRRLIDHQILELLSSTIEIGDNIFTRLAIIKGALDVEDIQRDLRYNPRDLGLAWACLLWYWAAWNRDCRQIIVELSPVLDQFRNWTPPCDKVWKWGLRVVGYACDKRLTERRNSYPEDWDWNTGLIMVFPEVSWWFQDVRREWRQALEAPSVQVSPEPGG
ncbi:hypothetical protein QBC37DRAFT_397222 [Rhypophila decipiens]|uniref:Uncharacterized protein n=1 Tax=Rhypophila decipiens TaxID=261697 RepID=A0AAN6YDY8_9PEZI|nr:hypothetical protein QBC37DRAFT_397222 [Rhypophila decipiens]